MTEEFKTLPFAPADILLPKDCDMELWSVVACDQYTSQPEYWKRVEERVGEAPSALHMILPESRLEEPEIQRSIDQINAAMRRNLEEGRFETFRNALIYIERTLDSGVVRRGLLGMVDLEQYDYTPGSQAMIRATEGTVLERIPPRVAVRKHAPLELPHVMLLTDDPECTVIEPLAEETDQMKPVYDFALMERGGRIRGWLLNEVQQSQVARALHRLAQPEQFQARYQLEQNEKPMLFAVGDGNHSLATAKTCWEQRKAQTPHPQPDHPARYALVELNNLHDPSLEFEPIHRVLFGVQPQALLNALMDYYPGAREGGQAGHVLRYAYAGQQGSVTIPNPSAQLPVGTLQSFLDDYLGSHPEVRIDYVHGDDVAVRLAEEQNTIAFLLPAMEKGELFPTVIRDGVLPRKTFSMGEAHDKRFYLEARTISMGL